jgi:hypothetical protein
MRVPRMTSGSGITLAKDCLGAINTYVQLDAAVSWRDRPALHGAGVGSSTGILYNANIQSGNVGLSGTSGDLAFAYQFLGGVRAFVTKTLFLFGEYKYFVTNYSWGSEGASTQRVKLDFQTHIVPGSIGWSF